MSQEVSKWLVSGLQPPYTPFISMGNNPLIRSPFTNFLGHPSMGYGKHSLPFRPPYLVSKAGGIFEGSEGSREGGQKFGDSLSTSWYLIYDCCTGVYIIYISFKVSVLKYSIFDFRWVENVQLVFCCKDVSSCCYEAVFENPQFFRLKIHLQTVHIRSIANMVILSRSEIETQFQS